MKQQRTSGSVLILALWVLFFLASLTVAAAGHVWAVLQAAERLQERVLHRMQAASAAAWAVSIIEEEAGEGTNVWDGLAYDAWNRDPARFEIAGLSGRLGPEIGYVYFLLPGEDERYAGVLGEEGKLYLDPSQLPKIEALLRILRLDQTAGAEALVALLGGGDGGLTPTQGAGYDRVSAVEDILLLEGVDDAFYRALAPYVTVYGRSKLNVNAVSKEVLMACFLSTDDLDEATAERLSVRLLDERRQNGGFREKQDFVERCGDLFADSPVTGLAIWSQFGLSTHSTVFGGIAAAGLRRDASVGIEIAFLWDTVSGAYVLWRER